MAENLDRREEITQEEIRSAAVLTLVNLLAGVEKRPAPNVLQETIEALVKGASEVEVRGDRKVRLYWERSSLVEERKMQPPEYQGERRTTLSVEKTGAGIEVFVGVGCEVPSWTVNSNLLCPAANSDITLTDVKNVWTRDYSVESIGFTAGTIDLMVSNNGIVSWWGGTGRSRFKSSFS